ncbi:hypothetical protein J6590_060585 [Homalodisca vitripennis]|nr:hypothetical protein J6590_060585 [Homalodisca vitripennis]
MTAFHQLTLDFENEITIEHLFSNLSKFQLATGAAVTIVLYEQKFQRRLRRGPAHGEFLKRFRGAMDCLDGTSSHLLSKTLSSKVEASSQDPLSPMWRGWSTPQASRHLSHTSTQDVFHF